MKIESIDGRVETESSRVSARIRWEDSAREPLDLYFEARGEAARDVRPDGNSLLLACAIPAMRHGERRIAIEGTVCPYLRDGILAAASLLEAWYGPRTVPQIEPSAGFGPPRPAPVRRAAAFLSGGMDSLDVFVRNGSSFPAGHPARFAEAIHVSGLPYTGPPGSPSRESFVARARRAATALARVLDVPLSFVRTNLGEIDRDFLFFRHEYFGSAYAAVAHLFSRRFTSVSFASAQHLGVRLDPLGSHPLLDPLYSSGALEFRHEGADRGRLAKGKALAPRPDLVAHLQVCLTTPFGDARPNCGRCEKCLHTQIELRLAGVSGPFPEGALSVPSLRAMRADPHTAFFWTPLPDRLRQSGDGDLADAIEEKIREMDRIRDWSRDRGWKGLLRRLDRRYLGSALLDLRRALRPARERPA